MSTSTKALKIKPGARVKLADIDPNDTCGHDSKDKSAALLEKLTHHLGELQGRLYAENKRALLVVLQGMDTSGKDGTIKAVFSALAPMGSQVTSFVAPSELERDHDFLWRIYQQLPRFGNIGVFNRSHYEDVLVVRVRKIAPEEVWRPRYDFINRFEALASDMGTRVVKIFLHIDRDEQRERLLERLNDPAKAWKYQPSDLDDRKRWDDYQRAYEDVLEKTSTRVAPWYVVPANKKWCRNLLVAQTLIDVLEEMDPKVPAATFDRTKIRIPK